ncbi:Hypothetical predicted protein [Mytilus galloprovincialis]|uniref:Uncharacterized protein n=1 Tax=Mytilus galloprovincialis TaxID=29158 RepID=A0A8B6FJY2_MYTGA|nr:Hypothetical predicted protein [Mytilus galloprovincialis]
MYIADKQEGAPVLPICLRRNATGTVPTIGVEINGDVRIINEGYLFTLACFSCIKPHAQGVDIYVNNVMEDSIRYHDGLCYHKLKECMKGRCTCSAKGKHFTWTYVSDLSCIHFTCAMQFKDGIESRIVNHQADLLYNGSVFIRKKKRNRPVFNQDNNDHNITAKYPEDVENNADKAYCTSLTDIHIDGPADE